MDDGEYGIVWCPAVITAVLVDSWLHAKITNPRYGEGEAAEWEDWFTWKEEGSDWRREGAGDDDDDNDDDTDDDDSEDEDEDEDEDEGEEKTYPKVRLVFKSRDAAQNGAEAGAASVGSSSRYSIPKVKSQPPKSHDTPAASAEAEGSAGAESSASAAGLAGAAAAQYYEETRDGSTTFSWREYERATMETDAAALGTRRGTKLRSLSPVGGAVAEVEAAEAEAARQAATGAGAEAEEAKHQAVDAGEGGGED